MDMREMNMWRVKDLDHLARQGSAASQEPVPEAAQGAAGSVGFVA